MKLNTAIGLIICGLMAACQMTGPESPETAPERVTSHDEPKLTTIGKPLDTQPSKNSRRFCKDDIFSLYVQTAYLSKSKPPFLRQEKSARRLKLEAHLEAYNRLNPQLPIFFSGMPVEATPRVYSWIDYFTGPGRGEFLRWMVRSESYKPILEPLIEREGIPKELYFLAMIESGFSNTAFSRSAATGTWQFMKPTARHYGLNINYWVDERRDPIKSTLAAARYLKDLHRQLRDWYLAIAAYNAGPGKINRAIEASKSRNYWLISKTPYLLNETKNYIPKLLAALIISSHPENYGFNVSHDIRNGTPTTTVAISSPYRLQEIADKLEISVSAIHKWNPELIRSAIPPSSAREQQPYLLRLPKLLADRFLAIEPGLEKLNVQDVKTYQIQHGDTLERIARRFQISLAELKQMNYDFNPRQLRPGKTLQIPLPLIDAAVATSAATPSATPR